MVKHLSDINQNSQKLENVPTPVNNNDAVNKKYVDDNAGVKSDTTSRITVSATPPTSPSVGDIWIDLG